MYGLDDSYHVYQAIRTNLVVNNAMILSFSWVFYILPSNDPRSFVLLITILIRREYVTTVDNFDSDRRFLFTLMIYFHRMHPAKTSLREGRGSSS